MSKMRKTTKTVGAILIILVAIRLALPYFVTNYVNKVLADIEGYTGSIEDVDLALYRGAYQIHGLELFSVEKDIKTPFVAIKTIDISVEWKALFDGAIVGEVILEEANLNFATSADKGEVQTGEENDWTKTITELLPLKINRFEIKNSRIDYIDEHSSPKVDLYFDDFDALATNLSNAKNNSEDLPSSITVRSSTIGNGEFNVDMEIDILKKVPDFDMNMSIENMNIPALNNFLKAYGNVDAESGQFNFYTEIALKDKNIEGYFKPLTKELKILDWKEEEEKFWGKLFEAVAGLAAEILENQPKDQVGTKIPISGSIENTAIGTWKAIFGVLKNAYLNPLQKEIDKTVKIQNGKVVDKDKNEQEDDKFLGIF